jgi:hypothetical protein
VRRMWCFVATMRKRALHVGLVCASMHGRAWDVHSACMGRALSAHLMTPVGPVSLSWHAGSVAGGSGLLRAKHTWDVQAARTRHIM